jgi:hypothetical protein
MPGKVDHLRFGEMLAARFPEIAATIDDCSRGLLHCEMGCVSHATNNAIKKGDVATVRQYFDFIDEVFQAAAPDVENAVYVSYLENVHFDSDEGKHIKARELLTSRLRNALSELEAYLAKLFENK